MSGPVRRLSTGSGPLRRVVVTGIGLVTPLGIGKDATWNRVIAGETAVRPLLPDDLPPVRLADGVFAMVGLREAACGVVIHTSITVAY